MWARAQCALNSGRLSWLCATRSAFVVVVVSLNIYIVYLKYTFAYNLQTQIRALDRRVILLGACHTDNSSHYTHKNRASSNQLQLEHWVKSDKWKIWFCSPFFKQREVCVCVGTRLRLAENGIFFYPPVQQISCLYMSDRGSQRTKDYLCATD